VSLSRGEGRGFDVRRLFAREDVLCALGAAASLGALSAVDRKMTTLVGVPAYLVAIYLLQVPLTAALVWLRHPGALAHSLDRHNAAPLAVHALFAVVGNGLLLTALMLAPAAYVNSVRRVSSVISVLLGASLFGEPGLTGRLVGALLTGLGAACLLLAP
jgi:drug/metabolite transporter (DMT)-like permease